MHQLNVSFTKEQIARLKAEAESRGEPLAVIIRDMVSKGLKANVVEKLNRGNLALSIGNIAMALVYLGLFV